MEDTERVVLYERRFAVLDFPGVCDLSPKDIDETLETHANA
jgi:hypothetical protein